MIFRGRVALLVGNVCLGLAVSKEAIIEVTLSKPEPQSM